MIYKTNITKQTNGGKYKRGMRGGGLGDKLLVGIPILIGLGFIAIIVLIGLGIILRGGGGGTKTQ